MARPETPWCATAPEPSEAATPTGGRPKLPYETVGSRWEVTLPTGPVTVPWEASAHVHLLDKVRKIFASLAAPQHSRVRCYGRSKWLTPASKKPEKLPFFCA